MGKSNLVGKEKKKERNSMNFPELSPLSLYICSQSGKYMIVDQFTRGDELILFFFDNQ